MGVAELHGQPGRLEDDPDFVRTLVRFAEGLTSETAVRKKYRLDERTWEALGQNDALVERIEEEKARRCRSGETAREKAQVHFTAAPDVLNSIMTNTATSAKHRIDAAHEIRGIAANGPESAPATDRFQITIVLSADGADHVEHYDKPLVINPNNDSTTPQKLLPTNKQTEGSRNEDSL
jgi:hypothetical protein